MAPPARMRVVEFVEISDPNATLPPAIRTRIRKKAAAKSHRDGWFQYNFQDSTSNPKRDFVVTKSTLLVTKESSLVTKESSEDDQFRKAGSVHTIPVESSPSSRKTTVCSEQPMTRLSHAIAAPTDDFSRLRLNSQFDILSLSALMTFEPNRGTIQDLATQPEKLRHILQNNPRQKSYFSYIPRRYGVGTCLDDAVRCIAYTAGQFLAGRGAQQSSETLILYGKALKSINLALSDSSRFLDVDVLAATSILSLCELLGAGREFAWIQHINGTTRLLELRGPEGYSSGFAKSLFADHLGAMTVEAILGNKPVFFEDPAWDVVFESLVDDNRPGDRHVINLWYVARDLPRLLADVTEIVCERRDITAVELTELVARAYDMEKRQLQWRVDFENFLQSSAGAHVPSKQRHELHTMFLTGTVLVRRARAAISREARAEDSQTANVALHILAMQGRISVDVAVKSLFLPQKSKVALATIATSQSWESYKPPSNATNNFRQIELIDKTTFTKWCALWGKVTTSDSISTPSDYIALHQGQNEVRSSTYSTITLPPIDQTPEQILFDFRRTT